MVINLLVAGFGNLDPRHVERLNIDRALASGALRGTPHGDRCDRFFAFLGLAVIFLLLAGRWTARRVQAGISSVNVAAVATYCSEASPMAANRAARRALSPTPTRTNRPEGRKKIYQKKSSAPARGRSDGVPVTPIRFTSRRRIAFRSVAARSLGAGGMLGARATASARTRGRCSRPRLRRCGDGLGAERRHHARRPRPGLCSQPRPGAASAGAVSAASGQRLGHRVALG